MNGALIYAITQPNHSFIGRTLRDTPRKKYFFRVFLESSPEKPGQSRYGQFFRIQNLMGYPTVPTFPGSDKTTRSLNFFARNRDTAGRELRRGVCKYPVGVN